jgi:pyridoxamine 5'-phosphate oxidase
MPLQRVRLEYAARSLLESRSPTEPLALFRSWLASALESGMREPNAMTLATVDARGRPHARMVLLKDAGPRGFTFYTNHASAKGRELALHPDAALVMWWPEPSRQVRIEGRVTRVSAREADTYFALRPRGAQLGAWASPQSRALRSRAELSARMARVTARFADRAVPRPPHWGGYRLVARVMEFWQGRPDRLHDRLRYTRRAGRWRRERLAP